MYKILITNLFLLSSSYGLSDSSTHAQSTVIDKAQEDNIEPKTEDMSSIDIEAPVIAIDNVKVAIPELKSIPKQAKKVEVLVPIKASQEKANH